MKCGAPKLKFRPQPVWNFRLGAAAGPNRQAGGLCAEGPSLGYPGRAASAQVRYHRSHGISLRDLAGIRRSCLGQARIRSVSEATSCPSLAENMRLTQIQATKPFLEA